MGKRTKRGNVRYESNPYIDSIDLIDIDIVRSLFGLSKTAFNVYLTIRERAIRLDGKVIVNVSELVRFCGFNQEKSVYNGLSELIRVGIIACSEDYDEFYYNPRYIGKEIGK